MEDLRFLAVDDSPTMRRIIVNTLKRLGYEQIEEASNGKEALTKIENGEIDFVITDWNMPIMDGLHFVQTLRANEAYADLPVLMITTRGVKQDIIDAMRAGVSSYIVKPFTPHTLREKIKLILYSKATT